MPNENKHARGRRDSKKEKRKRPAEEDEGHYPKKHRSIEPDEVQFLGTDNTANMTEQPFFGLLEDEEQEYFRHADELLELNDFPSGEERSLFLANVYKEAEGKELKIANTQSCSRLMERLILLSTIDQKKILFEKFSGHFLHLVQHRFASHCCETLFIQSAPVVTQELTGNFAAKKTEKEHIIDGGSAISTLMENLFLFTLNELEGHIGFLLTDRFGSHALRVLLVVLSGQPLANSSTRSLLQSKKKEKISITGLEPDAAELSLEKRAVPESFDFAINKIISDTVAGLDTSFIHVLSTHPTGNPTLQLLLELDLARQAKEKQSLQSPSIIQKLLPDDFSAPNSQSASFFNGLIYEPIGSRLLETIVTHAPGKLFKQIYRNVFKERIASLARNETASFVVIKVLGRLSKLDLEEAVTSIIPQIHGLIERARTNIVKALLERCKVREAAASVLHLTTAIEQAYGSEPNTLLLKMVNITTEQLVTAANIDGSQPGRTDPSTVHGSLLAQTMLSIPGPSASLIQASILALPPSTLIQLACTISTSYIFKVALRTTSTNLSFRRKLINKLLPTDSPSNGEVEPHTTHQGPILTLALNKAGSQVLYAIWDGTAGLMMLKERVCAILDNHKVLLRDDYIGRAVARYWMVELFGRRKSEWVKRAREAEESAVEVAPAPKLSVATVNINGHRLNANSGKSGQVKRPKTALELAREKFTVEKNKKALRHSGKVTGANAV